MYNAVTDTARFVVASRDDVLFQCSDHQTVMTGTRLVGPLANLQKTARQRSVSLSSASIHLKSRMAVALTSALMVAVCN